MPLFLLWLLQQYTAMIICLFAIRLPQHRAKAMDENAQIPALYPEEWLHWRTKKNRAACQDEYNIALMALCAITISIFARTL
jgi:hypothetical protein